MIGRDTELAAITSHLAAARAGSGRLLVVEGPAGIGKTTLLGAAAALARADGMAVLRARGNPIERDYPFGIVRQAFAPVQEEPGWDALCRGPARLADRVLTAGTPAPANGTDAMYAATHGLFRLVANLAARRPTLVCVDDVHWADAPSLRWLVGLARRVDELPLAVVAAVRAGEPVADGDLLGELDAAGACVRLGPLPAEAAAELVRAALPAAGPAFARACHEVTGGNPFLLAALLNHLHAEGADELAALGTVGPRQVARWVEVQLRRLPAGTREVAHALAVLGPTATPRQVAALTGLDAPATAAGTDALRAAGLVTGPGLALAHPIVAAALYDGTGPGTRALWHARAARVLATEPAGDPERAAAHLLRADPAGEPRAVDLLRQAAGRASARGAPETAATFLRRALAEPPDEPSTVAAVRLELALALAAGRQTGAAELAHDVVARIDDPVARADAALRTARALAVAGETDAVVRLHRLVLGRPVGVPEKTLARVDAELAAAVWTDSRTKPLAHDAVRRARAEEPALPLWRVNAAIEATFAGRPARECLDLLGPVLEPGVLAAETASLLPTVAGIALVANGQLLAARAASDAVVADASARGWPSTLAHGRFMRALAELPAGAVTDAAADARAALEFKLATATPLAATLWALCPLVDALVEADRLDDADDALRSAGVGTPPDHALTAPMILQSRARLRSAQGRPAEALADLDDAAARWAALDVRHPSLVTWRADSVEPLLALGRRAEAVAAAGEHLRAATTAGVPGPLGTALRAAARADRDRRIDLLDRAVRVTAGTPAGLAHVHALHDLGRALRRAGHRAEARDPLRSALALADAGGAARLSANALAELRAAGARPRRAALRGPDALTGAEQQVATLAAGGYTNRQIAQHLTLSRRTVETHLAHAYQKLGIHSRSELAGHLG
jgi:DNA-binding CsgD family transcriptional regulator